ncbi:hypothetical protein B0J18DRAFT_460193 [Chaetomium sp. MPI-SDFR-AT-0129]|nr:hypothetical protein B0J18DRAFT_460193 [Chaetomium sp. MPI-SDFR-AT-0129]
MPGRTFTLFPELPYELRRLIWIQAFFAPLSSAYYADQKLHPESYNAQFLPFPSVPLLHPYWVSRCSEPDEENRIRELSDIPAFLERTYDPDDVAYDARPGHTSAGFACHRAVRDYRVSRWRCNGTFLSTYDPRAVGDTTERVANTLASACQEAATVRESLVRALGDPHSWIDVSGRRGQRDNSDNNSMSHGGVFAFVDWSDRDRNARDHNHAHLVPDIPLDDDHPGPFPPSIHGEKTFVTATANVRELILSWDTSICVPGLLSDSERARLAPDYQAMPECLQWRNDLIARLRDRHPHLQCIYLLDRAARPNSPRLDPATHTLVFRGPAQSFYHVRSPKDWSRGEHHAAFDSTYRDRVPSVAVLLSRALNMVRPAEGDEAAVWHERQIEVRLLGCVRDSARILLSPYDAVVS